MTWEQIYDLLGIKDFIYFINSPVLQDMIFPIKLVFLLFTAFFFCAVMYLYFNSSYLKYQFFQDVAEFFAWQAYGLQEADRKWKDISKKVDGGSERDLRIAILSADDFLREELVDADISGDKFEDLVESAGRRIVPNPEDILEAHKIRNLIVYDVNYKLDLNLAKKVLSDYEKAIKSAYSY